MVRLVSPQVNSDKYKEADVGEGHKKISVFPIIWSYMAELRCPLPHPHGWVQIHFSGNSFKKKATFG